MPNTTIYFVLSNQFPVQNTEAIIIKLQPSSDAQKSAYKGEMDSFAVHPQPPQVTGKSSQPYKHFQLKVLPVGALSPPGSDQAKRNWERIRSLVPGP